MTQSVERAIQDFTPALPLAVAFSGGADSTALLAACSEKWPGQVVAWHVNHGLQSAATAFEAFCSTVCTQLKVELRIQRVHASHAAGQSPEDAARIARYKAFDSLALADSARTAIQSIAIAQHADDQVETLLLALSRGSGLGGLSGMVAHWTRSGVHYHRPLLQVSRADIRQWLAQRAIGFIEDPSNQDERFTRNRIRARVIPALQAAFPQYLDTFTRSADHAAQAQSVLDEVAQQDALLVYRPRDACPLIKPLRNLSRARQANLLRHWLRLRFQVVPSTAQLNELLDQVAACVTRGHAIHIKVGMGFVQRSGEVLTWYNP